MTINEAAALTELCDRTIRRRIQDGALKARRIGPRAIRIERESFLAWLNSPLDAA
jgi:excisionase family DNA binding protein